MALGTLAALAIALFFFSPRFAILKQPLPDTFEWARGLAYVDQSAAPLKRSYDPALRWRPLPPFVAHTLGLQGLQALLIPWAGVVALVGFCLYWTDRWLSSRAAAFAFTLLVATTSAVLVPAHWAGINDAWCWLGLLAVVFCRHRLVVGAVCLLCPWVEERFIIGLPLALWARGRIRGRRDHLLRELFVTLPWLAPYAAVRLTYAFYWNEGGNVDFLANALREFPTVVAWAPLGWWMGLRLGWVLAAVALVRAIKDRQSFWEVGAVTAALGVSAFLAHDLSRSTAILLPWLALGAFLLDREDPARCAKVLVGLAVLNLLLPAAHVVFWWPVTICPLPVELFHLWTWDAQNLPGWVRPFN